MKNLVVVRGHSGPGISVANMLEAHGYTLTIPTEPGAVVDAVMHGQASALVYMLSEAPEQDMAILRLVHRAAPELPLILLAQAGSLELQRQSLQLRPLYYAVSPIDEEELLGAVEAALSRLGSRSAVDQPRRSRSTSA